MPPAEVAARLKSAVAGLAPASAASPTTLALFANPSTAAALHAADSSWTTAVNAFHVVPATPGAADQAIKAAAVAAVASASHPVTLTLVSSDAAAFAGLLRWASAAVPPQSQGGQAAADFITTVVLGNFHGAGRLGRPDAWRKGSLPQAADHAALWREVFL